MPLTRSVGELLHRRHRASRGAQPESGPDGYGLDSVRAGQFTAGTLAPQDEARLADEVAELLPHSWDIPTKSREALTTIIDHLGGQRELMAWLDRYPGRPRLIARLYVLMGHLDRYSDDATVVGALRSAREQDPFPAGLRGYLLPQTTDETLGTLASRMEKLLAEQREEDASALALSTTAWLKGVADDANGPGAAVLEMGSVMGHLHQDIEESAEHR
ncbi:hypothetical protein [Streptomyces sp. WAC04114]|uniref:hypothetical protein n=1 Tax=Streptomyces sp. WAC04114 TaxID=2867961 RepID=UPI0021AB6A46|nr:hypothetical protein [Streptomyces sp. WAC04114]